MTSLVPGALLLIALVLALVLPPLWREARRTALVLALALPLGAAGLYALLGTPDAMNPAYSQAPTTLEGAIAQLERRLEQEPASVEGWVLLGRSRMAQQRFTEARDAFAKAHALLPTEPDLMVEYADAQMRAAGDGRFPATAVALLEQALASQPMHQRALFYLGAQRLQAGKPAEAVAIWERLRPLLDARTAEALRPQLAMAREQAGLPAADPEPAPAAGPKITVSVELAPEIAARLAAGDTLFVFARPADGAAPPVAVKRLPATGFPVSLELSDADSLMPTQTLSQQARVQMVARISKSGDAGAAAGDLEAAPQVLEVREGAAVTLRIDQVLP